MKLGGNSGLSNSKMSANGTFPQLGGIQMKLNAKNSLTAMAAAAMIAGASVAASAETLRIAAQADAGTMDPQAQNISTTISVVSMVYDALITRDRELKKVPALAESWENLSPTEWRFKLREGVTFHNGSAFGADDVAFSIKRSQQPTSQFSNFVSTIEDVRVVDDHTVDVVTKAADPLLLDKLAYIFIMDRDWAEEHNVQEPQNLRDAQETYSVLNANGTGPYKLQSREPDSKTVFVRHADYWGEMAGDIDEIVFTPISSDPTRIAALVSNEIDLVIDVPSQDVGRLEANPDIKIEKTDEFRTIFFGFDQSSDALRHGDAGGKNPFKDVRVRQAIDHAINAEAIAKTVMRGLATPTGQILAPGNAGYDPALDARAGHDPEKAKALLAEAGYPDGFAIRLDCPNNRYINDEQICKAVTSMLTQIGLDVSLNLMPRAKYFPMLWERDTSMFLMGFNSPYFDGMYALETLLATRNDDSGQGIYNYALYSNSQLDEAIQAAAVEMDPEARNQQMAAMYKMIKDDMAYVPVHHQVLVYAMQTGVEAPVRPDNWLEIRWVKKD